MCVCVCKYMCVLISVFVSVIDKCVCVCVGTGKCSRTEAFTSLLLQHCFTFFLRTQMTAEEIAAAKAAAAAAEAAEAARLQREVCILILCVHVFVCVF